MYDSLGAIVTLVAKHEVLPTLLDGALVWGSPVGASGAATDAEVLAVLEDPALAVALRGVFVLVGEIDGVLKLVSSSDLPHTLTRVDGNECSAWATRGLAAHALAERRPALEEDHIAEYVIFDYVLGQQTLLEGSYVEPAGTAVAITAQRRDARQYRAQDAAVATEPTTPPRLRRDIIDLSTRLASVPGVALGLTAGLDSALLASCAHEAGVTLPTFTLGSPGFPDVDGARAVALSLGWPHRTVGPVAGTGDVLHAIVAGSRWTEGLTTGRDLLGGTIASDQHAVFLTGSGGEIGRAFYWSTLEPDRMLETFIETHTSGLSAAARSSVTTRLWQEFSGSDDAEGALDRLYLRRMHKWLVQGLPTDAFDDFLPAFLGHDLVARLLAIPKDARGSGAAMRDALDLGEPQLRRIARDAVRPSLPRRAQRRVLSKLTNRAAPVALDWPILDDILQCLSRDHPPLVTIEVMGESWFTAARSVAASSPAHRRMLWNAVAVEGLRIALEADQ